MKYTRLLSAFLALLLVLPLAALAKGSVNVGDVIPSNLEFKDQTGKLRNFADLTGKKGVVLVFVRSVNWCPYCQKQLIEMDESTKRFVEWGYNVVSISYDEVSAMEKFVTTNKPKLTLLSDPASQSIRAFGILNEETAKGTMSYGIPYPGIYIVDKDKKVQATFFKDGYKERPAVAEILAKIEQLNPPEIPPMTIDTMGEDPILPEDQFIETPLETLEPILTPDNIEAPLGVEEVKEFEEVTP